MAAIEVPASAGGAAVATSIHTSDTYSVIQALTPAVGDTAHATDGPGYDFRCAVAGTWIVDLEDFTDVSPPPTTGWRWYNQGGSSIATVGGALVMTAPLELWAASRFRGYYRDSPTDATVTPYFMDFGVITGFAFGPYATEGAIVGLSDETGIVYTGVGSMQQVHFTRNSSPTVQAGQDYTLANPGIPRIAKIRVVDDGANRRIYVWDRGSGDWIEIGFGGSRAVTFTATGALFGAVSVGTFMRNKATLFHYAEGAL